jgi:polysaccharide chain length determinant protein (PEP-CTERM system associated)
LGDIDLRFYLSIFLRRLPYFLAIAVSISAIAVAVALLLPSVYRASARILVEAPQIPSDLARPTVPSNPIEQLQIIEQQITTRENVLTLAKKLNIYGDERAELSDADILQDMQERTNFARLQQDTPGGDGAIIFNISFDAPDPRLASDVVNEFVALILRKNVRLRTGKAGDTLQFFEQEVARLGADLTRIEGEILKFKNDNKNALPDSLDFRRVQQSSQQERLRALEREEAGLRSRRNNFIQMFEATGRVPNLVPLTQDQQMLQDLKRTLSEQLVMFSEASPNIVALKTRIAGLEKSVRQAADDDKSGGKRGVSDVDLQLSDIDERLRFIEAEKAAISKDLAELTKSIAATPANETILNALDRSRDNVQTQYNTATARLAEASTGEQIEIRSKGERFSVVEPAMPPQDPISPNRYRIAGMGVIGGFGLGLGLVVLLELLNRSVRRPIEIVQLLQAQPLATISYIPAPGERRFMTFFRSWLSNQMTNLYGPSRAS